MIEFLMEKTTCNPTNQFILVVNYMHGDGDLFSTQEYPQGISARFAVPAILFFNRCMGKRDYTDIEGYYDAEGEPMYDIPLDSPYSECPAQVRAVELYWYNGIGARFRVNYKVADNAL